MFVWKNREVSFILILEVKRNDIIYIPAFGGKENWGKKLEKPERELCLLLRGGSLPTKALCHSSHIIMLLCSSLLSSGQHLQPMDPSCFNDSAFILQPYELWNSSHLFPNAEEATLFLGTLDTIFLFSYAVGLFVSGIIGDRLNMRWVLAFGMCSSALVVFVFGTVTEWLHFYNKWFYCCLWIVNGLLQSTGWPCVVAVMGNWFGKAGRGFVFGLWSACASVGNILGAFLASSVLQYGYEYAFLVTASVQFAGGVIVFFGLVISPKEIGLPEIGKEGEGQTAEEDATEPLISSHENEDFEEQNYTIQASNLSSGTNAPSQAIGFFRHVACLASYCNNFGWKEAEADQLSIWYDVGGIIGGTIQGFISDVLQRRAPVLAISLILAIGSLFGYSRSPNNKPVNAVIMAITVLSIFDPGEVGMDASLLFLHSDGDGIMHESSD
ncbi:putative Sugar phosphate exchanger 3 protein [Naja naja]|nr:putative Sugar phosphate exchanger 3 protein [Naja naja]